MHKLKRYDLSFMVYTIIAIAILNLAIIYEHQNKSNSFMKSN